MRTMMLIPGVLALGLAACGQGGGETKTEAAAGGDAPTAAEMMNGPKPGLWRVTTEMTGMPGGTTLAPVETCIRTASFEAPSNSGTPGAECTTRPFTREGDAMVSSSTCTMQGMKADSTIRVTGDFNSRYVMVVTTRMEPPPAPNMAETTVTMTGERLGDCPPA